MLTAVPIQETRDKCPVTFRRTNAEDALLCRVRGEFREMPGMRLTVEQAMRLWVLDRSTCTGLLDSLVTAHFLERDGTGRYTKAHCGY